MKKVKICMFCGLGIILVATSCTNSSVIEKDDEKTARQEGSMDWISQLVDDLSNSLSVNTQESRTSEDNELENADVNVVGTEAKSSAEKQQEGADQANISDDPIAINESSSLLLETDFNDNISSDEKTFVNTSQSENTTTVTKSGRPTKVTCIKRNDTDETELVVQVLNSSTLPNVFQTVVNMTVAPCILALFYAPWCHFSAAASPHYNALPRIFPDITCIAINSAVYTNLNSRFGTVAIPTLLLLHNGQPVAKFNETQYTLENFAVFVKKFTGLDPVGAINVTSADFEGPLPSAPTQDADYLLWSAWIFIVSYCCYAITRSTIWHRMVETLRNNWQEAEAQHEHGD